jgi:hypothetical protein
VNKKSDSKKRTKLWVCEVKKIYDNMLSDNIMLSDNMLSDIIILSVSVIW